MDLQSFLLRCRDIQQLLSQYPEVKWPRVVRAVLLYGYFSLKSQGCGGLPVEVLEDKVRKSGYYLQVEDLLPTLKQQLAAVKSELSQLQPETPPPETTPSIKPPQDAFRKDYPSFKQPAKNTLVFQEPVQPLREGANYNVVFRPNDMWGHQWDGEDYTKEVYPDWWLDMGKMEVKTEKSQAATPHPEPKKRVVHHPPSTTEPDELEIESEDQAVQVPSLQGSQPRPYRSRANYSGWVGDFSSVVKRTSPPVHFSSSEELQSVEEPVLVESSRPSSIKRPSDAVQTQKAYEGSSKSVGFGVSSGSSMSTYRPTEEMKRFYQAEYGRLAGSGGTSMGSSEAATKEKTWNLDYLQAEFV